MGGKRHDESSNKDLEVKLNWLTSELEELARQQSGKDKGYPSAA